MDRKDFVSLEKRIVSQNLHELDRRLQPECAGCGRAGTEECEAVLSPSYEWGREGGCRFKALAA